MNGGGPATRTPHVSPRRIIIGEPALSSIRAFTIAELVIVTVIIAVLAGISIPHFANAMANQRLEAAVRRIVLDVAAAKSDAKAGSAARTIVFDAARSAYAISEMKSLDRPGSVYEVILAAEPYKTTITNVDFSSGTTVVFDGFGRPDTGGTVTIASGSRRVLLTLDGASGKVTYAEATP